MSGIGIQLDGDNEFLETFPDTTISMKLENPIFGDADKLSPGSYSLPFDLPAGNRSPRNSLKLKHPDVIENNQAYQLQKAKVFIDGVPFRSGNMKSKTIQDEKLSAYFTFGLNSISADLKKAKLRDIINETISIPGANITKKIYVSRTGDGSADWDITINGVNYQGEHLGIVEGKINGDGKKTKGTGAIVPIMEITSTNHATIYPGSWYVGEDILGDPIDLVTPSTNPTAFELNVVVPGTGEYTIYADSSEIDDYYDAFDSFLEGYPNAKLCFPVLFNAMPFNEKIKSSEIINAVNENGIIRNDPNTSFLQFKSVNINSLQPFLYLKWVLEKIADHFNFELEGDFYDHPDFAKMLIDNSAGLDVPQKFINDMSFVWWKTSFNIRDLVPDVTVIDFLKALQSRYNLAVYEHEATKKVRLCFRENIALSMLYDDITSLSTVVRSIDDERKGGYVLRVPKDTNDALSFDESITIGAGEVTYDIKCGRMSQLHTATVQGEAYQGVRLSRQFGASFSLRIFYHIGTIDAGEFNYQASAVSGDIIKEPLIDVDGIFYKHWQYWLHFERNRTVVKINVRLPLRKILRIDWELKRRFNRTNYLYKSLDIKVSNKGLQTVGVEIFTMK